MQHPDYKSQILVETAINEVLKQLNELIGEEFLKKFENLSDKKKVEFRKNRTKLVSKIVDTIKDLED